jgi:hypothetical protein
LAKQSPSRAVWIDPSTKKRGVYVLWRTVDEWADEIMAWATVYVLPVGEVATLAELTVGDGIKGSPLEGLPPQLQILALKTLEKRKKAK